MSPRSFALSKFAVLHRDSEGFVLEHPLAWCDVRIHDSRLLVLLDGPAADASGVPSAVTSRFIEDLHWCGILTHLGDEDGRFDALSWSAPDLWFHRRSTLGQRTVTWERFGPTKWAKGRFPQPPARRTNYPGEPIALRVPDLAAIRMQDPTLTAVLEDRVSTRTFDDARPITVGQLAELLYRTARTRRTELVADGEELVSRPYPSGGSLYELELYPVVRNVAGLEPGMYHYDSFDHVLRPVAGPDSKAVSQLLKPAAATSPEVPSRKCSSSWLHVAVASCGPTSRSPMPPSSKMSASSCRRSTWPRPRWASARARKASVIPPLAKPGGVV